MNSYNIETPDSSNCKMSYKISGSISSVKVQKQKIPTATRKWANPGYNSRTSVNSRNRTQRLKYNAKMGGQRNSRFSTHNNCINGQECSKYVAPGRSTKLFSLMRTSEVPPLIPTNGLPCNTSRINGMKQSCP